MADTPTAKRVVRRGICPVCEGEFAVTTAGVMRCHAGTEWAPGERWRKNCAGEGKPPRRIVDPIGEAEQRGYDRAIEELRARAAGYQRLADQAETVTERTVLLVRVDTLTKAAEEAERG